MSKQSTDFSQRMRLEYCKTPDARDVLNVEKDLGRGAISYQLSAQGKQVLFTALDQERRAKRAANKG